MKFTVIIVYNDDSGAFRLHYRKICHRPLLGYDADESPIAITGSQDGTGQTAASENAEDQAKAEEQESEVSGPSRKKDMHCSLECFPLKLLPENLQTSLRQKA